MVCVCIYIYGYISDFRMGLRAVPEIMFMYSFTQIVRRSWKDSKHHAHFSLCVVNKTAHLFYSFTQNMQGRMFVCLFEIIRPYVCITHELNFACPIIKLRWCNFTEGWLSEKYASKMSGKLNQCLRPLKWASDSYSVLILIHSFTYYFTPNVSALKSIERYWELE